MTAGPRSAALEGPLQALRPAVDSLWARLAPHGRPERLRRILFTAPGAGQGTTTVAACAAVGLARHLRAKVCLVETGAPSAVLATLLGLEPSPGISEVLQGQAERVRALRATVEPELVVVPAGELEFEPGMLATEEARSLLEWLGDGVDFLLLDAPPVHLHPEVRPLLWHADEAVVVLEAGRTRKDEAKALVEALGQASVRVTGSVLNRYKPELPAWMGGSKLP